MLDSGCLGVTRGYQEVPANAAYCKVPRSLRRATKKYNGRVIDLLTVQPNKLLLFLKKKVSQLLADFRQATSNRRLISYCT